jgi:hypothetical protein
MNLMYKIISIAFLTLLVLAGNCFAQNDLLSRVPELQETARQAVGGAKGCGKGTIILVTSRGEIQLATGLDPIHVFGRKIVVADLLPLLKARVEANRTGEQNPMSGEVGNLTALTVSIVAKSQETEAISLIAALLEDKDDKIRDASAISLINLAEVSEDLRREIEQITFPKAAVISAEGRGVKLPTWAKVKGDS